MITCTGCKKTSYLKSDYLRDLSIKTGIGNENYLEDLLGYGVIDDTEGLDEQMDGAYLKLTARRLIGNRIDEYDIESGSLDEDRTAYFIDIIYEILNHPVLKEISEYAINDYIDVEKLEGTYEEGQLLRYQNEFYIYENGSYMRAELEDIYEDFHFSTSKPLDFDDVEIDTDLEPVESSYANLKYELLASRSKTYEYEGFKITWNLHSSGIDIFIAKDLGSYDFYFEAGINNLVPNVEVNYEKGKIKDAFFAMNFKTSQSLGTRCSYDNKKVVVDKEIDGEELLKRIIKDYRGSDEAEIVIPVLNITLPLGEMPGLMMEIGVNVRITASGKVEILLANTHCLGFEYRNGHMRFINENNHDLDFLMQGKASSGLGLSFGVSAANKLLFDLGSNAGIKGELESIVHLYDEDGKMKSDKNDLSYSLLSSFASGNAGIDICGDLYLHWILDLSINSRKSLLGKMGFGKNIKLLDQNNQLLSDYTHFEDGRFVPKCTRKGKKKFNIKSLVGKDEKIVVNDISVVLDENECKTLSISKLPSDYLLSDLLYLSADENVAKVSAGTIVAVKKGATTIEIRTRDGKYKAYVGVVVGNDAGNH